MSDTLLRPRAASGGVRSRRDTDDRFDLVVPATEQRAIASAWLLLGTAALIGAGLFSILLVLARTPTAPGIG